MKLQRERCSDNNKQKNNNKEREKKYFKANFIARIIFIYVGVCVCDWERKGGMF